MSPNVSYAHVACVKCTWYVSCVERHRTDVGRQLRRAREARGLSQVALAGLLGVGERTVQAWERNERHPRLDALEEVARALGQPVAYFYGADEPVEAVA